MASFALCKNTSQPKCARWVFFFSIERKREREDSKMREIILVSSFKYMPDPLAGQSIGGHLRPFDHFFFRFVWSPKRDNKLRRSLFYTLCCTSLFDSFSLSGREKRKEKDQRQLISLLDIYGEYQRASAKHQRDSWESLLLTSAVLDDEKVEDQHLFFGWEIIDTHTFLERTYSSLVYVCVHILRPLSLFFSLPGPPMITWRVREAGRMGFFSYIVFFFSFFRDVVVLIVKRKERYSRQLLSVTGNEKRNIGGKCVSSLLDAARVLSSSSLLHTIS